jgi:hypothetical protein
MSLGIDLSLFNKSGSWFLYKTSLDEEIKVQGQDKLYEYFNANPDELELLYINIKNMAM